jgi:hypothetical protein
MSALVKNAIGNLADAVEAIELSCEALKDSVGPTPADAGAHELTRAAYSSQVAALHIAWLALTIARTGAVLQTVAATKEAGAADG